MSSVTIDGLSGVGKGAVAEKIARDMGYIYLSMGLLFRASAWMSLNGHDVNSETISAIKIVQSETMEPRIHIYERDITDELFANVQIEDLAPNFAKDPDVQTMIYPIVHNFCANHSVVLEGRIANQILPQADLKVFLWADPMERANRNYQEYLRLGKHADGMELLEKVKRRDSLDLARPVDPLRYRADMLAWDSTHAVFSETVAQLKRYVQARNGDKPFTVSVIIPVKNRENHLRLCLAGISQQTLDRSLYEIIVVDDGSTDDSVLMAQQYADHVITSDGEGQAYARNLGLQAATGDIVVFLDADMLVQADFLSSHLKLHERANRLIVLGARRHLPKDSVTPSEGRRDSREALLSVQSMDLNYLSHPWSIAYTCNVSGPRWLFLEEAFDSSFKGWGLEDIEWAYRLHSKGARWAFSSRSAGYHLWHDRTMTQDRFDKWKLNLNKFLTKHRKSDTQKYRLFEAVFDPARQANFLDIFDVFQDKQLNDVRILELTHLPEDEHLPFLQNYVYRIWDTTQDLIVVDSPQVAQRYDYEVSIGAAVGYRKNIRFFTSDVWEKNGKEVMESYRALGKVVRCEVIM